jgi:hypothetical protein
VPARFNYPDVAPPVFDSFPKTDFVSETDSLLPNQTDDKRLPRFLRLIIAFIHLVPVAQSQNIH